MSWAKEKLPVATLQTGTTDALDPSVQRVMTPDSHVMVDSDGVTSPVQSTPAPAPAPARVAKPPAPEQMEASPTSVEQMSMNELKDFIGSRKLTPEELDTVSARRDELVRLTTDMQPRPTDERVAELAAEQTAVARDQKAQPKAGAKKLLDLQGLVRAEVVDEATLTELFLFVDAMRRGDVDLKEVDKATSDAWEQHEHSVSRRVLKAFSNVLGRPDYDGGIGRILADIVIRLVERDPVLGKRFGNALLSRLKGTETEIVFTAELRVRRIDPKTMERRTLDQSEPQTEVGRKQRAEIDGRRADRSKEAKPADADALLTTAADLTLAASDHKTINAEILATRMKVDVDVAMRALDLLEQTGQVGPMQDPRGTLVKARWNRQILNRSTTRPTYAKSQAAVRAWQVASGTAEKPKTKTVNDDGSLTKEGWAAQDAYAVGLGLSGNGVDQQAEVNAARDADRDAWVSLDAQAPGSGGGSTGGPGGPTTGGTADAEPGDIDPREADQRILIKALERLGFDYSHRTLGLAKLSDPEYYAQLSKGEQYALQRYYKSLEEAKKEQEKDGEVPRSRIQKAIDWAVGVNRKNLKRGVFKLKGDTPSVNANGEITHSQQVNDEMDSFFKTFGIKRTKANEVWLFRAFQIYRGLSVDRDGKIFGEKHEELVVTDESFILALREMQENARDYNHPFAYSNRNYPMGGRMRYPGITSRGLAQFFTQNQTADNELLTNEEDFIAYSVKTFKEEINPRLKEMAQEDQRESMYDLVDAVLPELHLGIEFRPLNSRTSVTERLSGNTDFAELSNEKNLLAENSRDISEFENRASARVDKTREPGSLDRKPMTGKEFAAAVKEDWTTIFRNLPDRGGRFFDAMIKIFKINAVAALPGLVISSPPEKLMGVKGQQWGMDLLRRSSGAPMPTVESVDVIKKKSMVAAVHELIKLLDSRGPDAVVDAASRGVDFTAAGLHRVREGLVGAIQGGVGLVSDLVMDATTADWMKQEETAELFLEHLVYQLYISQTKRGGVTYTPEMIESDLMGDPIGFLRTWAGTPEGIRAIAYASNSSLGGVDWSTEALRQTLVSRVRHAGVAALVGLFAKFGLRAPQSMFWGSQSFMYLTKKGIDVISRSRGVDEDTINDSNNIMLGGNDEFWFGLKQNWDVDVARIGVRAPIYLLSLVLLGALGAKFGFEEPDDPKKRHLWYEWKIGGVAFNTNWFFMETLAFAMPTAIGVMAAVKTGDIGLGVQIIHFGIMESMEDSPWLNPFDAIEFIAYFDPTLQEEKLKSEGYSEGEEVSTMDFLKTQAYVWFLRRVVGGFDSGLWKSLKGDHGIFKGDPDLQRSRHQINTGDPDNPVDQTTYGDAQIRGVTMRSPAAAWFQNAVSGIAHDAVNGYRADQMPFASSSDPKELKHFNELSVFDTEGNLITDTDEWPEAEKQRVVNTGLLLIEGKTATEIVNQGIVIPPWARHLMVQELYRQKAIPVEDFKARDIAGEWTVDLTGVAWSEGTRMLQKAKADRNAAKSAAYAAQGVADKKLELLFDPGAIPYGAQKYNIKEQTYESFYTWKVDGPYGPLSKAGMPATKGDYLIFRDLVDFQLYAYGDEKSSIWPVATVDNPNNTYDAQTQPNWQKPPSFTEAGPHGAASYIAGTDNQAALADMTGYTIQSGRNKGKLLSDLMTGDGAVSLENTGMSWDEMKFILGSRGLVPVEEKYEKLNRDDYKVLADAAKWTAYETPAAASDGTRFYGGGGGGGSYSPSIYSHPAYSLNPDKPQGLYSKIPTFTRFDYLRPSVATKGSREAYRRMDF
jgi:hypothetical protein